MCQRMKLLQIVNEDFRGVLILRPRSIKLETQQCVHIGMGSGFNSLCSLPDTP